MLKGGRSNKDKKEILIDQTSNDDDSYDESDEEYYDSEDISDIEVSEDTEDESEMSESNQTDEDSNDTEDEDEDEDELINLLSCIYDIVDEKEKKKNQKLINNEDEEIIYNYGDDIESRPIMTKFEYTRLLGTRITQLEKGAKAAVKNIDGYTMEEIAIEEMKIKHCQ